MGKTPENRSKTGRKLRPGKNGGMLVDGPGPGRPRFKPIQEALREKIESGEHDQTEALNSLYKDAFGQKVEPTIKNTARKLYLGYLYGQPKSHVELSSDPNNPVIVQFKQDV